MIHTLTLVIIPTHGSIPAVREALKAEQFTFKHGTHVTTGGGEAAVGVACADFHDVSVVLDKASGIIKQTVYMLDARGRLYEFKPMRNTLVSLGTTCAYDETANINTGLNFFDFGSLRHAYYPLK